MDHLNIEDWRPPRRPALSSSTQKRSISAMAAFIGGVCCATVLAALSSGGGEPEMLEEAWLQQEVAALLPGPSAPTLPAPPPSTAPALAMTLPEPGITAVPAAPTMVRGSELDIPVMPLHPSPRPLEGRGQAPVVKEVRSGREAGTPTTGCATLLEELTEARQAIRGEHTLNEGVWLLERLESLKLRATQKGCLRRG